MCIECKGFWWIEKEMEQWATNKRPDEIVLSVIEKYKTHEQIAKTDEPLRHLVIRAEDYLDTIKRHYPDIYARVEKLMALQ